MRSKQNRIGKDDSFSRWFSIRSKTAACQSASSAKLKDYQKELLKVDKRDYPAVTRNGRKLSPGRLFKGQVHPLGFKFGINTMLQIGLLAADLLEGFFVARLIELLVAIETIPGIPQNFACVRYVAELPGQFG